VGGLVTLPAGSSVVQEDSGDNIPGSGHVAATVRKADGTLVRDFMVVMTKDLNHRYADGTPVEHMNGEGHGLPEDSQESSGMALNYGIEPLWFRFAIPPNAPFGAAGGASYGFIPNAHLAFSNALPDVPGSPAFGDPATPVLVASAGQEVRMHVAVPHSTSRGSTLGIHGHVWQRDPYICPGEAQDGLAGRCNRPTDGKLVDASNNWVVGSKALGHNPTGINMGGQESLTPYSHYDFFLPYAGGRAGHTGDYLFRDKASFGVASGLWGILRVAAIIPATGLILNDPSLASPQLPGASVGWTATASPVSGTYEYQYQLYNYTTATWSMGKAYADPGGNAWTWNTFGLPQGLYWVNVWARTVGSTQTFEVESGANYTLGSP